MGSQTKTECVTGASGFIGSWLVMRLLQRNYMVRATVRDPTNEKKVKHLVELPNAETHLTLRKADLSEEGSFDEAIQGCNAMNEVIQPTIRGLIDIMKSCAKAKVRRLVFTSSAGTVNVEQHQKPVYDENCWSDIEFVRSVKMTGWNKPHGNMLKKTTLILLASSQLLWSAPSSCHPCLLASSRLFPITGNEAHYSIIRQGQFVHLDDLCESHIYLYENPNAEGRYICSSHDATVLLLAKMLRENYPEYNIPTSFEGADENTPVVPFSSKKLIDAGFKFKYTLEDMFTELLRPAARKDCFLFHTKTMPMAQNRTD
ncbi:NAD(P)-binding domain [Dillenia turbinata]|uniref:NAD(P)-binding domain n=1 Tax=Dillenia turbinata TaxID=194707 RepID=A0AAN8W102_9MAGN